MANLNNAIARLNTSQLGRARHALRTAGFAVLAAELAAAHAELQSAEYVGNGPEGGQLPEGTGPTEPAPAAPPSQYFSAPLPAGSQGMSYADGSLNLFKPPPINSGEPGAQGS